jgi:hypothetical protein
MLDFSHTRVADITHMYYSILVGIVIYSIIMVVKSAKRRRHRTIIFSVSGIFVLILGETALTLISLDGSLVPSILYLVIGALFNVFMEWAIYSSIREEL